MNKNATAIILIAVAAGIYFTYTKGVLVEAAAQKKTNDQYSSALASAAKLVKVRDKTLEDFNHVDQADMARLNKMIPGTVDNIRLVIDMSNMARKSNLSIRNVKAVASAGGSSAPKAPTTVRGQRTSDTSNSSIISTASLDVVNVSFSVTATYPQFISFLQDLEANLRIMDVTHLTLSATDTGTYDFSVELRTYWLRQ